MPLDPRIAELIGSGTTNERLLALSIRHAVFLQRFKGELWTRVLKFLEQDVLPELESTVRSRLARIASRGFDRGIWSTQRFKDLVLAVKEVSALGAKGVGDILKEELAELARKDSDWTLSSIQRIAPVTLDMRTPSATLLRTLVTKRAMGGKVLGDLLAEYSKRTQASVIQQLRLGLAQGESVDQMVRRLVGTRAGGFTDGAFKGTRNEAKMIVRTSATHVSAHAREATYYENQDVVKGVMLVATLDSRTSLICINYDGRVYPVGEGPRPPFHPFCRTTTSPVLKSWKELGIDLKEAPEGTRASMDGQAPESLKYPKWLESEPKEVQDEVLGKTRARLWRNGDLDISEFVDRRGDVIGLDALYNKYGLN